MPIVHGARRRIAIAGAASCLLATLFGSFAGTAVADTQRVTAGDLHAFATSSDPAIAGRAVMVRTASGSTKVTLVARGLLPNTDYHAHVHSLACGNANGGSHYRFDPAGPAAPPNEIWLDFTTNADGVGVGRASVAATAGAAAVSVVVHAPGGARIACADLG